LHIQSLEIDSVKVITPEFLNDERGYFSRLYCHESLAAAGIDFDLVQMNASGNHKEGTLRGLHYQVAPAEEGKLVRCTVGRVLDIVVDVRPDSPTYLKHCKVELSAETKNAIYVPPMFAHGYVTLTPGAELTYLTSAAYTPACERGVRYDDPALGIELPRPVAVISKKDRSWPLLKR